MGILFSSGISILPSRVPASIHPTASVGVVLSSFLSYLVQNVPSLSSLEMSPCAHPKRSHSLLSRKKGFSACGGFRQGRAPSLRAPQVSLDGFRHMPHNGRTGEWERSSWNKGTFLTRAKGDIIKVARHVLSSFLHPFLRERIRRPRKRPGLPPAGKRKPGTASFPADFSDTQIAPLSGS